MAAPRAAPELAIAGRLRGPVWAAVPVASIVGVIFAIRYLSSTASFLTWLALIAVPILAAAALGWAMRGARWWLAPLAAGLFAVVLADHTSLVGEGAGALLDGLSCVTLGVLLASVAPTGWLKLGIIAMAGADVWLVASDLLQAPNNALVLASPGPGLPQLQSELFGTVSLGYGDLFVAGVLGALLAREGRNCEAAGLLVLGFAAGFDLLFFVIDELPATVPVALALIVLELASAARRRRLRRVDGIPRPAT